MIINPKTSFSNNLTLTATILFIGRQYIAHRYILIIFNIHCSLTWQVHRGREHGWPSWVMVLVMAVVVTAGGRGGRGVWSVVAVARHSGRGGCGGRQVVSHGRVVRPGGHRRGGTEPVRGMRHLTASGQVAVSHCRVVHVRRRRSAGQTVKIGLVQIRVIHVDYSNGTWQYISIQLLSHTVISSDSTARGVK